MSRIDTPAPGVHRASALDRLFLLDAPGRNHSIEGLRAIAVLMVFNVHYFAPYYKDYFSRGDPVAYGFFETLHSGHFGVDIFFVISGFLIWKILYHDRRGFIRYGVERVNRLMPAYVLNCFMLSLSAFSLANFVANVVFLPQVVPSFHFLNVVSWSLAWEWIFYFLMIPIAYFTGRGKRSSVVIFSTILVLMACFAFGSLPSRVLVPDPFRFSGFLVGCMLCEFYPAMRTRAFQLLGYASVPALVAMSFVWGRYDEEIYANKLTFGLMFVFVDIATALFIAFLLNFRSVYRRVLEMKPLRCIGQVSYTLYLTHSSLSAHIAAGIYRPHDRAGMVIGYVVWLAVALVIATFLFCLTERQYLARKARPVAVI